MNELNSEIIKEIKEILKEMVSLFREVEGSDYYIKENQNDKSGVYGFITEDFSFYFSVEAVTFFLSFRVGLTGKRVCELTKVIDLILDYKEYKVIEDHYVDFESKEMLFGVEAQLKSAEDYLDQNGRFKCPICDNVYPKKLQKDNGMCILCDKMKDEFVWN